MDIDVRKIHADGSSHTLLGRMNSSHELHILQLEHQDSNQQVLQLSIYSIALKHSFFSYQATNTS